MNRNLHSLLLTGSAGMMTLTAALHENPAASPLSIFIRIAGASAAIAYIYNPAHAIAVIRHFALLIAATSAIFLLLHRDYHPEGLALLASAACGFLYYRQLPGIPLAGPGLMRVPYIKNTLIGLGWAFATTTAGQAELFGFRFFFVTALSLLSDLADAEQDHIRGLYTAVHHHGKKTIAALAGIIFILLPALMHYTASLPACYSLTLQGSCLLALLSIPLLTMNRHPGLSSVMAETVLCIQALAGLLVTLFMPACV